MDSPGNNMSGPARNSPNDTPRSGSSKLGFWQKIWSQLNRLILLNFHYLLPMAFHIVLFSITKYHCLWPSLIFYKLNEPVTFVFIVHMFRCTRIEKPTIQGLTTFFWSHKSVKLLFFLFDIISLFLPWLPLVMLLILQPLPAVLSHATKFTTIKTFTVMRWFA